MSNNSVVFEKDGVIVVRHENPSFSTQFWLFSPFINGSVVFTNFGDALRHAEYLEFMKDRSK